MKKTAKYYKENPEARAKKKAYDTKYHTTPERVNYREELNAANRKAGSKKGDGKDMTHSKGGTLKPQSASKNRSYNGSGKRSRYSR